MKLAIFGFGLIAAGLILLVAALWCVAQGQQMNSALCVDGHPAKRSPNVTYAGLDHREGFQRDHIMPLCLGGLDTLDNLQYQPLDEAEIKDRIEWRTCEQYCRGEITLYQARANPAFVRTHP